MHISFANSGIRHLFCVYALKGAVHGMKGESIMLGEAEYYTTGPGGGPGWELSGALAKLCKTKHIPDKHGSKGLEVQTYHAQEDIACRLSEVSFSEALDEVID